MDLLALQLDRVAAHHLARALESHRRWCRANGHQLPPALADLALMVSDGQERPNNAPGDDLLDDGQMSPLLYTYAEVAGRLRVSERTIRRLVLAGELTPVDVGARNRRIHHLDLETYAAGLRGENRSTRAEAS